MLEDLEKWITNINEKVVSNLDSITIITIALDKTSNILENISKVLEDHEVRIKKLEESGPGPQPEGYTITFEVIEYTYLSFIGLDIRPIADATVHVKTFPGRKELLTGTTDSRGICEIRMPAGAYVVTATAEGYKESREYLESWAEPRKERIRLQKV